MTRSKGTTAASGKQQVTGPAISTIAGSGTCVAGMGASVGAVPRIADQPEPPRTGSRTADLGALCKNLVLGAYAPATILINQQLECLYSYGPAEIYVRVAPGYPTHGLLSMLPPTLRARVQIAVRQANTTEREVVITNGRVAHEGKNLKFDIHVRPVRNNGERLFLICFINQPRQDRTHIPAVLPADLSRVAELERELKATQLDLQAALHSLDAAKQEQSAAAEDASSVNEEYQTTNEELLTSKEELQSLNEELTALNSQLQETLEHSRTTSNDLQNVLYSTDVATLFLDTNLNIRFFTPASRALFTLIPGDVGRPLADLHSLSTDQDLQKDAEEVLKNFLPIERQTQAQNGAWFSRRILPYRTQDGSVAGVVITFIDITQRKLASAELEESRLVAERANIAKTRFLAAASHDLRQPLQTVTLLSSMLAKVTTSEPAQLLLVKLDDTITAMTGILNTLLDINQIDAGIVQSEMVNYPIDDLFRKLVSEFSDLAESRSLKLRFVPSRLNIFTDPRILEQMLRNLLSNALKYTNKGGILMGCRHRGSNAEIQVWDTGLGIPAAELNAIFDEYHQIDNPARERSRGLGLGLSIVQRLASLMKHRVNVRSVHGKGSVFSIGVAAATDTKAVATAASPAASQPGPAAALTRTGKILVIEDDPDIRQLLEMFLTEEGHQVATARDRHGALALITPHTSPPDLILADYNLPNGANGLEITKTLREMIGHPVAVVIVTGDTSASTMKAIAEAGCVQLNKPMKLKELNDTIQSLLMTPPAPTPPTPEPEPPARIGGQTSGQATVFVVDDDLAICNAMREVLEAEGYCVRSYSSGEAFLSSPAKSANACLVLDANLPGMSGFDLLNNLPSPVRNIQTIMITGQADIKLAVQAMKSGAFDFIEKPVGQHELLAAVSRALARSKNAESTNASQQCATIRICSLTTRQRQVMDLVLAGEASKNIAADLGISQRTVENHRASIMEKTGTKSLPALARLAMVATGTGFIPSSISPR